MASNTLAGVKGSAIYKKKDGTLSISKDQKTLIWMPLQARDASSSISLEILRITNLQQTPETSAKAILKIFVKTADAAEAVAHMFTFNAPTNPRVEANTIKETLSTLISTSKANDPSVPKPSAGTPVSAAMAIASAVKSGFGSDAWYEDSHLKGDIELQQSLMKKNPELQRTWAEARRTKPESTTELQFNTQFWSTRTDLLRAHAADVNQKRGQYNVLAAVKARSVDGEMKMNISAEQIQLIFSQHPLIKKVYDENVPKIKELEFWSRFFLSRLFTKLKGEKYSEQSSTDPTFDRYLNMGNGPGIEQVLQNFHIPNMLDLEGNVENQGGTKSGNREDYTMRPENFKAPIIRTLNDLSEKIMANVAPSDINPANPIGMDEETFNSLALRDLQQRHEEDRMTLNVREQDQIFTSGTTELSVDAQLYAQQVPAVVLDGLTKDIGPLSLDSGGAGGLDLRAAIGVLDDSDSEEEEEQKAPHVGSKSSLKEAQNQVMQGIMARRAQISGSTSGLGLSGLSQSVFDRLTLTNATTTEFLHHFWVLFLSGDPDKAAELAKMFETLSRSMDRINAVAAEAESDKQMAIKLAREEIMRHYEQTGQKKRLDVSKIGGGEKVVREMMAPTIKTVNKAVEEYKKAMAKEGLETS